MDEENECGNTVIEHEGGNLASNSEYVQSASKDLSRNE